MEVGLREGFSRGGVCEIWGFGLGTGVKGARKLAGLERSVTSQGTGKKGVTGAVSMRRIKKEQQRGEKGMEKK